MLTWEQKGFEVKTGVIQMGYHHNHIIIIQFGTRCMFIHRVKD